MTKCHAGPGRGFQDRTWPSVAEPGKSGRSSREQERTQVGLESTHPVMSEANNGKRGQGHVGSSHRRDFYNFSVNLKFF